MKITEFRKLIREEVRKVLKEATGKAYALVISDDGIFSVEDLTSYSEESYLDAGGKKLDASKVLKYPIQYGDPKVRSDKALLAKWTQTVTKLQTMCDFYDVIQDGGENAVIAAVPKGTSPVDYVTIQDM